MSIIDLRSKGGWSIADILLMNRKGVLWMRTSELFVKNCRFFENRGVVRTDKGV